MKSHFFQLILYRIYADLKAEADRGYLGFLWWIVEPILFMAAFYVVFGIVMQRGEEGFVYFLLTGLIIWKWFGQSVSMASNSLLAHKNLINQVKLPVVIFPSISVGTTTVKFSIVFILLLIFLVISGGGKPSLYWLLLPIIICIQFIFILSICFISAAIVPVFPDLRLIIDNGLLLLFFLSGVFFDIESLPEDITALVYINPMAMLIDAYRSVLLHAEPPRFDLLFAVVIASIILLVGGFQILRKLNPVYPRIVL
jgi:lipopolysaccharide transport system permease protein